MANRMYHPSYWLGNTRCLNLSYLLPRRLVYWCAVRVIAHATSGKYSHSELPTITAMETLNRWGI